MEGDLWGSRCHPLLSLWCEHNEFQENTVTRTQERVWVHIWLLEQDFLVLFLFIPIQSWLLNEFWASHCFRGAPNTNSEARVLWPPDMKSWLIGEDPDAGKDWRPKEKGAAEDEMVRSHHRLNGHELSKLQEIVEDKGAWHATVHCDAKSRTWPSNWVTTPSNSIHYRGCLILATSLKKKFFLMICPIIPSSFLSCLENILCHLWFDYI